MTSLPWEVDYAFFESAFGKSGLGKAAKDLNSILIDCTQSFEGIKAET